MHTEVVTAKRSAAVFWSIEETCPVRIPPERLAPTLGLIWGTFSTLGDRLRENGIELTPTDVTICATASGWSLALRAAVDRFGFHVVEPDYPGKRGADSTLLFLLRRMDPALLPQVIVFVTVREMRGFLQRVIYELRGTARREVWVVDTETQAPGRAARSAQRFLALERLLHPFIVQLRESLWHPPERQTLSSPPAASPSPAREVAVFWDVENFTDVREEPEEQERHLSTIASALWKLFQQRDLHPHQPFLIACAQNLLPIEVVRALRKYGFRVHLTHSRREDAAENLLMERCERLLRKHGEQAFPRQVVILSGDNLLSLLVSKLTDRKRSVCVISHRQQASRLLRSMASEFISVEDLLDAAGFALHTSW